MAKIQVPQETRRAGRKTRRWGAGLGWATKTCNVGRDPPLATGGRCRLTDL